MKRDALSLDVARRVQGLLSRPNGSYQDVRPDGERLARDADARHAGAVSGRKNLYRFISAALRAPPVRFSWIPMAATGRSATVDDSAESGQADLRRHPPIRLKAVTPPKLSIVMPTLRLRTRLTTLVAEPRFDVLPVVRELSVRRRLLATSPRAARSAQPFTAPGETHAFGCRRSEAPPQFRS